MSQKIRPLAKQIGVQRKPNANGRWDEGPSYWYNWWKDQFL